MTMMSLRSQDMMLLGITIGTTTATSNQECRGWLADQFNELLQVPSTRQMKPVRFLRNW